MTIDREKLKALCEAAIKIADPWYSCDQLQMRAVDPEPAELMAEASPEVVLALIAEVDQLKAENEALKSHRTDWQAKCLKRGFQYVREPDDHYVLADLPEMAELLGELLGVEVRAKDGDSYGEALSVVQEQLDAANNAFLQAYEAEKECEALRKDLESHKRMLLAAACDVGAIGEALGADMDDDGSEIEGLAKELRKDAERYRWIQENADVDCRGHVPDGDCGSLSACIDAAMAKEAK